MLKNDSTNDTDRNSLLSNFEQYKALQRVGSTSFDGYNPALNEENYPGWDINDNNAVTDFIWEVTSNSSTDEQNNSSQLNGIIGILVHHTYL